MAMATEDETAIGRRRVHRRWVALGLVSVGLLIFVLANIHLVYVSIDTQPDCVPHSISPGQTPDTYRAAKSSC